MKKKICLISPKFRDCIGGMETHAYEFAKWFNRDKDYEIISILTSKDIHDGIKVKINYKNELDKKTFRILTTNFKKDLKNILKYSPKDTAIYFFNSPTWLPLVEGLKHYRPNAQIIVRSGGTDLIAGWVGDESNQKESLKRNKEILIRNINQDVDALIVNSNFSKKRFLKIKISKTKMVKLTGGVDCNRFNPLLKRHNSSRIVIINASRFIKCKAIQNCIEVFNLVRNKTGKKIVLKLIGEGPEKESLKALTKSLGAEKVVRFISGKDTEEISKYFNNADIFLHLPITLIRKERGGKFEHVESMGRVFCEAAASGLPAVSFKIGGVPEVIESGKTGFLLKEGDIKGASNKLLSLIENDALRTNMGKNGRKKAVAEFDWEIIFGEYKRIFKNGTKNVYSKKKQI